MSADKPSLYVVEKKEVIILVVLFVLVTVLSFTLGVRYGESVGKKAAIEQELAARDHGDHGTEGGGTLGAPAETTKPAEHGAHGESAAPAGEHGEKAAGGHEPAKSEHGAPAEHGEHAAPAKDEHGSHAPEAAAKASVATSAGTASHEAVDKNSDEYLLNALKEAGVEAPGGKAPHDAKLPDEVKTTKTAKPSARALSGSYVIQVGSHPTRNEAEIQVRQLKAKKIDAEILPPFKDRQGEWHRVVLGSYRSKRDAEKEAGSLKGKGAILSYFVWRLP